METRLGTIAVGRIPRNLSVAMAFCPDGWVIDGNYAEIQDLVLSRWDTLVFLLMPMPVILWRLTRRTVGRIFTGEVLWGTNRETWKDAFFQPGFAALLYSQDLPHV